MLRFKIKELLARKEYAERRRITLQEVADETGIHRVTLSRLMNQSDSAVRGDSIDRLCRYFGCRIEELMEYVPDDAGPPSDESR